MEYKVIGDGSRVEVAPKTTFIWQLACCDCGLVHDILVEAKGSVVFTINKNNRATGQKRRGNYPYIKEST